MSAEPPSARLRMLVVIASYGLRNMGLLREVIRRYQQMSLQVDIVVVSDAEKDLGPGIEVVVGLPDPDPWSLPFAHKAILADRLERYDLFAYSEDDMAVTEENIHAFLHVTPALDTDEIAGFLRYEKDASGRRSLPDAHGRFHWRPESVRRRGAHVVAEFTNDHAAYYLMTREQLRRAIASGGFLRAPYEGRYDMLCTAATDVYAACGLRKIICISSLDDFLIHHASDRYAGKVGVSLDYFRKQVDVQMKILDGHYPASTLCDAESRLLQGVWSKSYYEEACGPLIARVPRDARHVLSIGCGWGATEAALMARGARVTVLPLDSVMGALASEAGMEVVYGPFDLAFEQLEGRVFDCVVVSNLLHVLEEPQRVLRRCARLVGMEGSLVLHGPHLGSLHLLLQRAIGKRDYRKLRSYGESGIHLIGPRALRRCLAQSGLQITGLDWIRPAPGPQLKGLLLRMSPSSWVLEARSCARMRQRREVVQGTRPLEAGDGRSAPAASPPV